MTPPIVSATDAPAGTEALPVKWVTVAVPDLGVMRAAIAPLGHGVSEICIQISDDRTFLTQGVRLRCRSSTESLQFRSRNEPSAQNDGRHAASIGDVCQRVRLQQDQSGLLAHFNGAFIGKASEKLSGIPR